MVKYWIALKQEYTFNSCKYRPPCLWWRRFYYKLLTLINIKEILGFGFNSVFVFLCNNSVHFVTDPLWYNCLLVSFVIFNNLLFFYCAIRSTHIFLPHEPSKYSGLYQFHLWGTTILPNVRKVVYRNPVQINKRYFSCELY